MNAQQQRSTHGKCYVVRLSRQRFAWIGAQHIEISRQSAFEIGTCSGPEIGLPFRFLLVLGFCFESLTRWHIDAKIFEAMSGAAGKDEYALPDRVSDLSFLKFAILHRRQQVLQPH